MRRTILRAVLMTGAATAFLPLLPNPATAAETRAGDLVVVDPWSRAVSPRAPSAAGYVVIRNTGAAPDRLIGGETPNARAVEMHETAMLDGVMRMRSVGAPPTIPPGGELRFAPGGMHLMLLDPRGGFTPGGRVPLTLIFERAGRVTVELEVTTAGARGPSAHQGH